MRYLTKSRFTMAITCPAKLKYLDDHSFANSTKDNDFLKALAEGGHQVGALAKYIFPGGIEIKESGHDAQVEKTAALLEQENVVLFEAAIRVGQMFVRVDLLRKVGNLIELFEVKAKSYNSVEGEAQIIGKKGGITSEFKPYLYDVAFQRHVLRKAFPDKTIACHLVMPNKAIVCPDANVAQRLRIRRTGPRTIEIDVDESLRDGVVARNLLYVLPVDRFLDILQNEPLEAGGYVWEFAEGITELESRIDGPPFAPKVGAQCKSCEFRASATAIADGLRDGRLTCWSEQFRESPEWFAKGTVFDLNNFRGAKDVIGAGKIRLSDLETEDVKLKQEADKISSSHRQWLQCEESRDVIDRPVTATKVLAEKLAAVVYPLHFIDFETATPAMPFHAGRRPYEQLLFQFSHHQLSRDGGIAHLDQCLESAPGVFPNFDVVRKLASALSADNGSVIHWWHHERTVLAKVREQLLATAAVPADRDELVAFIDSLIGADGSAGRLVDLGMHITHPLVYLPRTNGSSSIKKALPALIACSDRVRNRYSGPTYGTAAGIPSKNFEGQTWVQFDENENVRDPYTLLAGRFGDPVLDVVEDAEENSQVVADGGAAMVAYGLLQGDSLSPSGRQELEKQMLRYCELDTLAMVMAFESLLQQAGADGLA